jgi:chromosome partitioning protein
LTPEKLRLVIANQRGGVAKSTTTHTLARHLADRGRRVLIMDTDPQGSIGEVLGLRVKRTLQHLVIEGLTLEDCVIPAYRPESGPGLIDVLGSDRTTVETEATLMARVGRELLLKNIMAVSEDAYDAILIDTAPSITLLQTCAMVYAQRLFIPVAMDHLSLLGAVAASQTAGTLNGIFGTDIRPVAYLPVMVQTQYQMAKAVLANLQQLQEKTGVPVLPHVRTDQTITKAARVRQFLKDFAPESRAVADYTVAFDQFLAPEADDARATARITAETAA